MGPTRPPKDPPRAARPAALAGPPTLPPGAGARAALGDGRTRCATAASPRQPDGLSRGPGTPAETVPAVNKSLPFAGRVRHRELHSLSKQGLVGGEERAGFRGEGEGVGHELR